MIAFKLKTNDLKKLFNNQQCKLTNLDSIQNRLLEMNVKKDTCVIYTWKDEYSLSYLQDNEIKTLYSDELDLSSNPDMEKFYSKLESLFAPTKEELYNKINPLLVEYLYNKKIQTLFFYVSKYSIISNKGVLYSVELSGMFRIICQTICCTNFLDV